MDNSQKIADLKERFFLIKKSFDADKKQNELRQFEAESLKENFWTDSQKAQKIMKKISLILALLLVGCIFDDDILLVGGYHLPT